MKKLICAVTVLAVSTAQAETIYVDDDAPLGGDGLNWNTAYRYLQDALANAAGSGGAITKIRIAQGTYKPDRDEGGNVTPGDRLATFQLVDGAAIVGGFAGPGEPDPNEREVGLFETVLSGDLLGNDGPGPIGIHENSVHVVTASGLSAVTLSGLVIAGGNADGAYQDGFGGGLIALDSNPTLEDCTVVGNTAVKGGGIYTDHSNIQLTRCHFDDNVADSAPHLWKFWDDAQIRDCTFTNSTGLGGRYGVVLERGSATVRDSVFTGHLASALLCAAIDIDLYDCTFADNCDGYQGAATFLSGGYSSTFARFFRCTFENNHSGLYGGAIFVSGGQSNFAHMRAYDCVFVGNSAGDPDMGTPLGGAICTFRGPLRLYNCAFIGNEAFGTEDNTGWGGAILYWKPAAYRLVNCVFASNAAERGGATFQWAQDPSHVEFDNCTVTGNVSTEANGAIHCEGGTTASVTNSIVWGNGGSSQEHQVFGLPDTLAVDYSCIQGLTGSLGGIGNIDLDPQFVDPDGPDATPGTGDDDLRLLPASPCIDAGDNDAVPPDEPDLDGDGDVDEPVPVDFDNNPRFLEIPETPDTGNGTLPIVDMGAYESLGGGCLAVTSQEVVCHGDGTTFTVNIEGLNACTGGTTQVTFTASGGAVGQELCFTALVNDGGFCCTTEICVTIPDCTPNCDLNGDGIVGIVDYLSLFAAWGSCSDCGTCPADFDGDCSVGILDMLILLGNWG